MPPDDLQELLKELGDASPGSHKHAGNLSPKTSRDLLGGLSSPKKSLEIMTAVPETKVAPLVVSSDGADGGVVVSLQASYTQEHHTQEHHTLQASYTQKSLQAAAHQVGAMGDLIDFGDEPAPVGDAPVAAPPPDVQAPAAPVKRRDEPHGNRV